MLLENFDWGYDARTLQIFFALGLGVVLGAAAQVTRFCLRRAIVGEATDRGQAGAIWLTAFATALLGFLFANMAGFVELEGHRYLDADVAVAAILIGGLAFGAGMVLTRGCASRLTVLAATGNMRAVVVLTVFALVAHATLKGVLAPVRTTLSAFTTDLPFGTLYAIPFAAPVAVALAVVAAVLMIRRHRPAIGHVILGAVIGLVPVLGWATTSFLLMDEFDPLAVQSAAFTLPWADTLFWVIASSAIPAGFGTGFIAGVLVGSFLSATLRRELSLQGFEGGNQMLRYIAGAGLMGFGGVLAGGCTIGAGLSGSATLSLAALLALASIVIGATFASRVPAISPSGVTAS
ncbi:YeeE/YedE family protein [Sulfitobacter sp. F26169L]|uniref:YeeE/YedE family protein n=1 Tax=Sulfitobacter sp. F26169L TaxID=2996015 RepID=UPI002260F85B|nr:YeeE/YedE family protein [Sulfitobacter sp. F26169L]MCX7565450.1 YeeE/YedE family protein [Sulfitobacter sp. F26169L]